MKKIQFFPISFYEMIFRESFEENVYSQTRILCFTHKNFQQNMTIGFHNFTNSFEKEIQKHIENKLT